MNKLSRIYEWLCDHLIYPSLALIDYFLIFVFLPALLFWLALGWFVKILFRTDLSVKKASESLMKRLIDPIGKCVGIIIKTENAELVTMFVVGILLILIPTYLFWSFIAKLILHLIS